MGMTPEDWERLLVSEGMGVIGAQSHMPVYEDWKHGGGQTLGAVMLPDKEEDDPVLVGARREIEEIAARLPSRWSVLLQLRARGLTQRAIAERLGVRQPTVGRQLQRVLEVLPALLETRPVTGEEISSFVEMKWPTKGAKKFIAARRKVANEKREKLISSYLRCWSKIHAAWEAGIPQCDAHKVLVLPVSQFPDDPVSQLLAVINSVNFQPDRASLRGRSSSKERRELQDFTRFL